MIPIESHNGVMNERISPYPIRPSAALRAKLKESANFTGRTLHAEIIARLEASFESPTIAPVGPNKTGELEVKLLTTLLDLSDVAKIVDLLREKLPSDLPESRLLSRIAKRYRLSEEMEAQLEAEHTQKQTEEMKRLLQHLESQTPKPSTPTSST